MRENIIRYQDEGGGEEDLNAVDLLPLKVPGQETDPDTRIKLKGEKLTLNARLLFFLQMIVAYYVTHARSLLLIECVREDYCIFNSRGM